MYSLDVVLKKLEDFATSFGNDTLYEEILIEMLNDKILIETLQHLYKVICSGSWGGKDAEGLKFVPFVEKIQAIPHLEDFSARLVRAYFEIIQTKIRVKTEFTPLELYKALTQVVLQICGCGPRPTVHLFYRRKEHPTIEVMQHSPNLKH